MVMSGLSELEDFLYVVTNVTSREPQGPRLFTEDDVVRWRAAALEFESSAEGVWEQKFWKTSSDVFEYMKKWLLKPPGITWGWSMKFERELADLVSMSLLTGNHQSDELRA